MDQERQEDQDTSKPEHGSSGLGTLLSFGTAAVAAVSLVAMLAALNVAAPVIALTVGGLGLLGGGLLVAQNHKEKVNAQHVNRHYNEDEGYHKEPEVAQDQSLIHQLKGRSDLPARLNYIDHHYSEYGIKPLSPDQYRTKYMGTGAAIGLLIGAAVMAGLAVATAPVLGPAALGFAGVMGALAGGSALAFHTVHTMKRYDAYVDSLAAEGEARKKQAGQNPAPEPEYDNGCTRTRTYCEEVTAARQQQPEVVQVCR